MQTKQIRQHNLSLSSKYTLIDKYYTGGIEVNALTCSNCDRLICNVAIVKDESQKTYTIGFDCLETLLINNNLLSGNDVTEYERVKKMIPKVIRFSKKIKETVSESNLITGIRFDKDQSYDEWFIFYWLVGSETVSRRNDFTKIKEMDINFLIETLKNIFPKLNIYYN